MAVSPTQIIIILVIVLIVFGAGKLPSVMGDVGKGIKNMKKGMNDEESDSKSEITNKKEQQEK